MGHATTLSILSIIFFVCLFKNLPPSVHAAPIEAFSALETLEISSFRPFTAYASTAYCKSATTQNWTCGANCDANPNFQPIASGGNGNTIQFWFVGYDPKLQTVIVAHQGTDQTKVMSLVTDLKLFLSPLNRLFFPGMATNIRVHTGFGEQHAKTAKDILAAVKYALLKSGFNQVTLVGHSLGAALSVLDGVYLSLNLPGVKFQVIGYGMPRVGNQAFADYVDANIPVTRINNRNDFIPVLPHLFLGFRHTQGEIHIQADNSWIRCLGQDNTDKRCTTGSVGNFLQGNLQHHSGPYDGVVIFC